MALAPQNGLGFRLVGRGQWESDLGGVGLAARAAQQRFPQKRPQAERKVIMKPCDIHNFS